MMDRRSALLGALSTLVACGTAGAPSAEVVRAVADPASRFHKIYGDASLRADFRLFYENVFSLYPVEKLHGLVLASTEAHSTDKEIYEAILAGLPGITPIGATVTYALPALKVQKRVMADQAANLLGDGAKVDGYVEMGTVGRYLNSLEKRITVTGPVYVLNDVAPTNGPADMVERGQLAKVGAFVHLADYAPVSTDIPDASVDVVSNLIGFHHCPDAQQGDFIASLRRVLRAGGRLLVREHDVKDAQMDVFVALAHDVFNAGVKQSWDENDAQFRHFRSVMEWEGLLAEHGFTRLPGAELQAGDPTDNTLMAFVKA